MKKTRTQMANVALGLLGMVDEYLTDIDADTSDTCTAVNEFYEVAREEVLTAHNWPIAKKTVALVAASDVPPDEWDYAYTIPTDLLKLIDLPNGDKDRVTSDMPLYELASGEGLGTANAIAAWGVSGQYGVERWITTTTAHGCVTGDRVYLTGISGETSLNNTYFKVAVYSTTILMLLNDEDGSVYGITPLPSSPTGGSLQRVGAATVLYTDVADAVAEYTYRVDESDDAALPDYDYAYVMAFAYRLAFYLSGRLVRDNKNLRREMETQSEEYLNKARALANSQQRFRNNPPTSSYVKARY